MKLHARRTPTRLIRAVHSTLPLSACTLGLVLLAGASGCSDGGGGPLADGASLDAHTSDLGLPPGSDGPAVLTEAGLPVDQGNTSDSATPPGPDGSTTPPLTGDRCAQAQTLTLGNGPQTLNGNTSSLTDEHSVECGGTVANKVLAGPQAYYRFTGQAGHWYRVTLAPQFNATLVLFSSSACTKQAIEADCTSGGSAGFGSRSIEPGMRQALYLQVPASGAFYAAVESTEATEAGPFALTVEPFTPPTNTTCSNAQALSFSGNKATVSGDTSPTISPAEFPTLDCDLSTMAGPQLYYSFDATAGTKYQIKLTAEAGQFLFSYFWGASCDQATVSADCSSKGATGDIQTVPLYSGESRTTNFTAPVSGRHHVAVGSQKDFNFGSFTLEISF